MREHRYPRAKVTKDLPRHNNSSTVESHPNADDYRRLHAELVHIGAMAHAADRALEDWAGEPAERRASDRVFALVGAVAKTAEHALEEFSADGPARVA
jgi:hypothetical protein